jgi:hypothetical protein
MGGWQNFGPERLIEWEGGPWKREKRGRRTLAGGREREVKKSRVVEWFLRHHTEKKTYRV